MNPLAISSGPAASTCVRFTDADSSPLSGSLSAFVLVRRPSERQMRTNAAAWPAPAGLAAIA